MKGFGWNWRMQIRPGWTSELVAISTKRWSARIFWRILSGLLAGRINWRRLIMYVYRWKIKCLLLLVLLLLSNVAASSLVRRIDYWRGMIVGEWSEWMNLLVIYIQRISDMVTVMKSDGIHNHPHLGINLHTHTLYNIHNCDSFSLLILIIIKNRNKSNDYYYD